MDYINDVICAVGLVPAAQETVAATSHSASMKSSVSSVALPYEADLRSAAPVENSCDNPPNKSALVNSNMSTSQCPPSFSSQVSTVSL